jgi:hypothetical protein
MKITRINFFLLFKLLTIRQLKRYAITRFIIKEKINDETLVKGTAIILLLMIGKNQNRIAKGMVTKIFFCLD